MLKLLSPSLLDRQQAYIDFMANLYRMHGVPFYAAHCGCKSSEPIPVIVFGAHARLQLRQAQSEPSLFVSEWFRKARAHATSATASRPKPL